jgi:hypothetical protein
MSKRFITIFETPDFPGMKRTLKVPFFAVFSILFKIHLALLTIFCIYVLGAAFLSMILSALGFGYHNELNGLYF